MDDVDCSCTCHHCDNPLNHTSNDSCYDSRMAYDDLHYCDCDSCSNAAIVFNTCDECSNDDNDE